MAVDRGGKGAIIGRWVGIFGGLALVGGTAFGAWEFIQQQGGTASNPFDVALAALRRGIPAAVAGAVAGGVWGTIVALVRG